MKKSLKTSYLTVFVLTVLSIGSPLIIVITIIYLLTRIKLLKSVSASLNSIEDIEEYCSSKKGEADAYFNEASQKAKETVKEAEELVISSNQSLEKIKLEIKALKAEKKKITEYIDDLNRESIIVATNFTVDENITSEEYKNKLSLLKNKISDLIKSDAALLIKSAEPKKVIRDNAKQILRCFESESSNIISSINAKNVDAQRSKLNKSYENLNKIFEVDGVALTLKMLEYKLEELNLVYAYQLKKEQEKEEQKAIREQMVEEERVRREIEREKAKIEKEEAQFKGEITKLMGYLQKASDIEKQLYIDKINELEEKLKLVEKDKENVLQREQNTRAGYVYIISNIGSFGENIYKIGMTRRLEPMDRVKELGDASVPFEFDVHAMIFSEDAPALETILHNTFQSMQVNKINPRKEFFKVELQEIEKVVKDNHNATVEFTEIAKAEQYRESLRLEQMQSA